MGRAGTRGETGDILGGWRGTDVNLIGLPFSPSNFSSILGDRTHQDMVELFKLSVILLWRGIFSLLLIVDSISYWVINMDHKFNLVRLTPSNYDMGIDIWALSVLLPYIFLSFFFNFVLWQFDLKQAKVLGYTLGTKMHTHVVFWFVNICCNIIINAISWKASETIIQLPKK